MRKSKKLAKESLDVDSELSLLLKSDPVGGALAIKALFNGLMAEGVEKHLYNAIRTVTDKNLSNAMLAMAKEAQEERDSYISEGTKKMNRKIVKESYEVSPELADKLNSILADEFLASNFYRLAELAMKGKKQHLLTELAKENGEDELEDHFKNLSEWMQSKGLRVVTNYDEMLDITNGTVFTVEDGDSTLEVVDKLIKSEEEAIEAYENLIPETDLDLHTMLCGFLKDEREHLKALQDCKDEMGGSEQKPKHPIFEGGFKRMRGETNDVIHCVVSDIDWDTDGEEVEGLPSTVEVDVPADECLEPEDFEEWISDYLSDEYGFCHNGFKYHKECC